MKSLGALFQFIYRKMSRIITCLDFAFGVLWEREGAVRSTFEQRDQRPFPPLDHCVKVNLLVQSKINSFPEHFDARELYIDRSVTQPYKLYLCLELGMIVLYSW